MRTTGSKALLLFASISILFLVSCQKEVSFQDRGQGGGTTGGGGTGGNNQSILGDYDFVGLFAHTSTTLTATDAGQQIRAVTTSDYYGKNCGGTAKITANQMIATNFVYSVDTLAYTKTYINGILIDDSNFPFVASIPPSSSTSSYVQNNADSITVTGAFGLATDPSGNTSTGSVGERISWSGDTLILKASVNFSQTVDQGGAPALLNGFISVISKLKKHP